MLQTCHKCKEESETFDENCSDSGRRSILRPIRNLLEGNNIAKGGHISRVTSGLLPQYESSPDAIRTETTIQLLKRHKSVVVDRFGKQRSNLCSVLQEDALVAATLQMTQLEDNSRSGCCRGWRRRFNKHRKGTYLVYVQIRYSLQCKYLNVMFWRQTLKDEYPLKCFGFQVSMWQQKQCDCASIEEIKERGKHVLVVIVLGLQCQR